MKNQSPANSYSYIYRNGLTIVFLVLFIITLLAQAFTGWKQHNQELVEASFKQIDLIDYLCSGHFISATFENFESEFLQMTLYVLLTINLRQIGSSESKKLDEEEDVDREPVAHKNAPWPVKKGGWYLTIYKNSLSICFCFLFLISWILHFYGSWQKYNVEQLMNKKPEISFTSFGLEPEFWFETFQNWQSEFLSVAAIVFLSIYLRQKGSPESKPVDASNLETGR